MKKAKSEEEKERQHYNTWGYKDPGEVASDIQGGIHSSLLQGYYVFAYRSLDGDIKRLVVTRTDQDTWMYGMITTGWTCLIPRITRNQLLETLIPELETKKVNKDIISDLKFYISQ